jgi:hypothetical protein
VTLSREVARHFSKGLSTPPKEWVSKKSFQEQFEFGLEIMSQAVAKRL